MKMLSIIFAVLAVISFLAHGFVGPIFTEYDWCVCGQSRAWLEFDDSLIPSLRDIRLFPRIEKPGDPHHQHLFCDAIWERQYPVLVYIGVGFGLLSAGLYSLGNHRRLVCRQR